MKKHRSIGLLWGVVFCAVLCASMIASPAWGQAVSTGTVAGQVVDAQNAAITGATVTLTDKATNTPRTTTSNDTGRYIFTDIPPGQYDLSVSKENFSQTKIVNQTVSIGDTLTLNVSMKVGSATEVVEVTAAVGAQLQTNNSAVGETVSGNDLLLLPNFGRDASTLATLQPATNPTGQTAGVQLDQNSFQLDGANNTNDMDGSMNIYTPSFASNGGPTGVIPEPVESIEEFKVNTNNQTADFVGAAGGQIMMGTKKGTDSFHGTLYEYYQDSAFGGANTWNNDRLGRPIVSNHQNRFGGNAGGPVTGKFLGGKWYLFGEYDGRRFPNATTITATVPTATLRAGVVGIKEATGAILYVNTNAAPVTVNGTTYQPSMFCGSGGNQICDPRQLGVSPTISQIWNTYEPLPNDAAGGDQVNTQGYIANIALPQTDNFGVIRVDHDFSPKWHFTSSYHYYHLNLATNSQYDIGGFFPGDTFGDAVSKSQRPQVPSLITAGLTTNITANTTNDLHFSYLRDFWQWVDSGIPPQLATLGDTLEPGGDSQFGVTVPYDISNQSTRTRFWDGQDKMVRDDITILHGNHLIQVGGLYQRNYLQHQRNDNGGSIQDAPNPVALLSTASTTALDFTNSLPPTCAMSVTTGAAAVAGNCVLDGVSTANYRKAFAEALGIITQTQQLYSRVGPQLTLQAGGTPALEQSIVPTYNLYFTDSWHVKPTFTLTYGLGYQIEMPPYEINGKQVMMVDQNDVPISTQQYLSETYQAGIKGQIYNPILGFATVANVAGNKASGGEKYPYHPFYHGLSPRISFAWNPNYDSGLMGSLFGHGKTVVRGGYARIYGRLNGVDQILVPLLAPGLLQAETCQGPVGYGPTSGTCGGATTLDAFRVGPTGSGFSGLSAPLGPAPSTNLPQPFFPGVNGAAGAGAAEALDPNFQPNQSDEIDLTIQRELPGKWILEVGYIGRRIRHEFAPIDISAVPYMLTLGGQTFAQAWSSVFQQVNSGASIAAQPWFESALGGAGSAYCTGFASCTAAVASKEAQNINTASGSAPAVYDLWQDISSNFTFGRSMASSPNCVNQLVPSVSSTNTVPVCQQLNGIGVNGSFGYGNYNGVFASLTSADFHGLTARSNFTWGRSLGTQSQVQATSQFSTPDPWDLHNGYGPQPFDVKFLYNLTMVYQPRFFHGEHGIKGMLLTGWSFAPLFTAQSGNPLAVNVTQGAGVDCQSFGESDCNFFATDEGAVFIGKSGVNTARGAGASVHQITTSGTVGSNGTLNLYSDPASVIGSFRAPILGVDTNPGSFALRGMPTWNLDFNIAKDFRITERVDIRLSAQFTNILNHHQFADPTLEDINDPTNFGVIGAQNPSGVIDASTPRAMELGMRIHF